jgi:hypoxanthine phosphoribosyltransferase
MIPTTTCPKADLSPMFLVTWTALEEALSLLAATPEQSRLAPDLVSALRKSQRGGETPGRLLMSILSAAIFLADAQASPDASSEAGSMA